jgi:hypothetical protein
LKTKRDRVAAAISIRLGHPAMDSILCGAWELSGSPDIGALEAFPLFTHPGNGFFANGSTSDHDHGGDRDNHHDLQRFEAFFVIVELAERVDQFRGHVSIPLKMGSCLNFEQALLGFCNTVSYDPLGSCYMWREIIYLRAIWAQNNTAAGFRQNPPP